MTDMTLTEKTGDFYTLALTNPMEAIEKYVADDFEWVNPLPEVIPFGGTYKGKEGLVQYLTALDSAIEMSPLHINEVLETGNTVALVMCEENTKVKSTGKKYSMPCVHVVNFNDGGKITRVREYNDTREMVKAFNG